MRKIIRDNFEFFNVLTALHGLEVPAFWKKISLIVPSAMAIAEDPKTTFALRPRGRIATPAKGLGRTVVRHWLYEIGAAK